MSGQKKVPVTPRNLKLLVQERIHDPQLRKNLSKATTTTLAKRADVVADFTQWEEMRSAASEIKDGVIANLDTYLEQFEEKAVSAGATVHWATDAQAAQSIVYQILRDCEAKLVVKSKSMTTEEIRLGHFLEEQGIEAVETDLGEYIVQLAGELPSHITAPALHKSREEIGELFAKKLGIDRTNDPEALTAIARDILREKFLKADAGISGVNFAVADSGTICIVENEGNGRLSTALPKTHIAVMGIEKLLPDMQSLTLFLQLLARSSTGQRITSYTSLIRGPKATEDLDGPEDLHIIILDNGRTDILEDDDLRQSLNCIRCGACLNTCPVYQTIGGHSYGTQYSGPIGAVISPSLLGLEEAGKMPYASSLCGACAEICPVQIDLHHLLLHQRRKYIERAGGNPAERMLFRLWMMTMKYPALYSLNGMLGRMAGTLFGGTGRTLPVPGWSKSREFPAPAQKSFKQLWKEHGNKR